MDKQTEMEMPKFSLEIEESFLEPSLRLVECPLNSPDGLANIWQLNIVAVN